MIFHSFLLVYQRVAPTDSNPWHHRWLSSGGDFQGWHQRLFTEPLGSPRAVPVWRFSFFFFFNMLKPFEVCSNTAMLGKRRFSNTPCPAAGPFEINAPQVDYVELVLFPVLRKLFGVTLELQVGDWPRIQWIQSCMMWGSFFSLRNRGGVGLTEHGDKSWI